ncbi:MAG: heparan-alpha-glucosaminide N-acetyltransferase domain-containing protein [Candidatus Izemoplasmatales bacterium]
MKNRIWELDFFRGFAIMMMIFDHLMYDFMILPSLFGNYSQVNNEVFNWLKDQGSLYWHSDLRFFGHFFFLAVFLLISGISFNFSKNNLQRGLKLLIVALLITVVTLVAEILTGSGFLIVFGIIHMFALAIIITYFIRKFIKNELVILVIGLIILGAGFVFKFYDMTFQSSFFWKDLPEIIIGTKAFGADHFGLIPYTGILLIGTVIGKTFYQNRLSLWPKVNLSSKNFFIFLGQKSLIIFVAHQIVLLALVYLIGYIFGYRI